MRALQPTGIEMHGKWNTTAFALPSFLIIDVINFQVKIKKNVKKVKKRGK